MFASRHIRKGIEMTQHYFGIDRGRVAAFVLGAVVAVLALAAGVAFASDGDTVHACVNPGGQIRIVGVADHCRPKETSLNWSIEGPQGPQGPQGDQGDPGEDGTSCSVTQGATGATINCEDGTTATVSDGQDGAQGPSGVVEIYIRFGNQVILSPGVFGSISAFCDPGDRAVGGGYLFNEGAFRDINVFSSLQQTSNHTVQAVNTSTTESASFTPRVVCVDSTP